jgi:hypothetical protein
VGASSRRRPQRKARSGQKDAEVRAARKSSSTRRRKEIFLDDLIARCALLLNVSSTSYAVLLKIT